MQFYLHKIIVALVCKKLYRIGVAVCIEFCQCIVLYCIVLTSFVIVTVSIVYSVVVVVLLVVDSGTASKEKRYSVWCSRYCYLRYCAIDGCKTASYGYCNGQRFSSVIEFTDPAGHLQPVYP